MLKRQNKRKYYCVQSVFYTNGRVEAGISATIFRRRKPRDLYEKRWKYDIYEDWFDNKEKALSYAAAMRGEEDQKEVRILHYFAVSA